MIITDNINDNDNSNNNDNDNGNIICWASWVHITTYNTYNIII